MLFKHFYKKIASQRLNWWFLSFYFLSIISALVISFIEALATLRICPFRYMFGRNLANMLFSYNLNAIGLRVDTEIALYIAFVGVTGDIRLIIGK